MNGLPYTGTVGETITDLSQRLLASHGRLRELFRLDAAELAQVRGLSDAKAIDPDPDTVVMLEA
jgi:DNA repair protein RadC